MHIVGTTKRKVQESRCHRCVRESIDEYESAHIAVLAIRIERDRTIKIDIADADLVQFECSGRNMFKSVDVHFVLGLRKRRIHCARSDLQEIRPTGKHLVIIHPDNVRFELICNCGWSERGREHITTADVYFIVKRDGY
ncbi:unannotated protein [freshwater metagenome]|uniref:Unannotated protein n=1 Tax=freshwater metagenome TaxID=449393 RepID=A0A6J6YCM9_9ZZZZ